MDKYVCARPVHPGEILKEEIEYRGISQGKLATQMGMSYKMLNHILNERRPLTVQTAMLLEAALGIDSDLMMRMQLKYNSRIARKTRLLPNDLQKFVMLRQCFDYPNKRRHLSNVVSNYFQNSYKEMVCFFTKEEKLSERDLEEIIQLIKK